MEPIVKKNITVIDKCIHYSIYDRSKVGVVNSSVVLNR